MKKSAVTVHKESSSKKHNKKQKAYLTKRILVSAAKRGIREAAEETMKIMGYTIIAKDGWLIRKNSDGTMEKLEQINP